MQTVQRPTAVIIDDSRTMRMALTVALTREGIEVVAEGESGAQAAVLYARHKPTLIMLDIVLPDLDGVSAAKAILEENPTANVVMCSSLAAHDRILACKNAGVSHFILKPFTPDRIAQVVQGVLKSPTAKLARAAV